MKNDELNIQQIKILADVMEFSSNMLEKEKNDMTNILVGVMHDLDIEFPIGKDGNEEITSDVLKSNVNNIAYNPNVPNNVKKQLLESWSKYIEYSAYYKKISDTMKLLNGLNISNKPSWHDMEQKERDEANTKWSNMSSSEKEVIKKGLSELFTSHNNSEIKKGESSLMKIISTTNTSKKISSKIEKLNEKISSLELQEKFGNNSKYKISKIDKKINKLKIKDIRESNKRTIIMIKREEVLKKRNDKIAKAQAKMDYYTTVKPNERKKKKFEQKVENLKMDKIKMKSGNRILFKERVISLFSRKDNDPRHWTEERLAKLSNKAGRSL